MISQDGKVIVVFGATGKQGGAVIKALEESPVAWNVKAATRNPASASARELVKRGVMPVAADMGDTASLTQALDGAYGVYSVQGNFENDHEGREIRYGRNVVDSARSAGVSHFVFGSVGGADRDSGVPHFVSKRQIELHLLDSGIPFTILRPASFMDNFRSFPMRTILLSMFKTIMSSDTELQLVATRDIGLFAAHAFEQPELYFAQQIELAGDSLTVPEIVQTLRRGNMGPTVAFKLPGFVIGRLPEDFPIMVQWFEDHGFDADIDHLRRRDTRLLTLSDWVLGH